MNITRLSNKQAKLVTKSCLQTALIQLLDKKDLNEISISELTRKAGVSRTAFYSNYQNIDDVLLEIIDQELTELNTVIWDAINRKENFFPPIIQKMKDNYDLYSLTLKSNIEKTALFQMREYIKAAHPSIDKESYYLMTAAVGALRGIIIEWFMNCCDESVEVISDLCNQSTEAIRDKVLDKLEQSAISEVQSK